MRKHISIDEAMGFVDQFETFKNTIGQADQGEVLICDMAPPRERSGRGDPNLVRRLAIGLLNQLNIFSDRPEPKTVTIPLRLQTGNLIDENGKVEPRLKPGLNILYDKENQNEKE